MPSRINLFRDSYGRSTDYARSSASGVVLRDLAFGSPVAHSGTVVDLVASSGGVASVVSGWPKSIFNPAAGSHTISTSASALAGDWLIVVTMEGWGSPGTPVLTINGSITPAIDYGPFTESGTYTCHAFKYKFTADTTITSLAVSGLYDSGFVAYLVRGAAADQSGAAKTNDIRGGALAITITPTQTGSFNVWARVDSDGTSSVPRSGTTLDGEAPDGAGEYYAWGHAYSTLGGSSQVIGETAPAGFVSGMALEVLGGASSIGLGPATGTEALTGGDTRTGTATSLSGSASLGVLSGSKDSSSAATLSGSSSLPAISGSKNSSSAATLSGSASLSNVPGAKGASSAVTITGAGSLSSAPGWRDASSAATLSGSSSLSTATGVAAFGADNRSGTANTISGSASLGAISGAKDASSAASLSSSTSLSAGVGYKNVSGTAATLAGAGVLSGLTGAKDASGSLTLSAAGSLSSVPGTKGASGSASSLTGSATLGLLSGSPSAGDARSGSATALVQTLTITSVTGTRASFGASVTISGTGVTSSATGIRVSSIAFSGTCLEITEVLRCSLGSGVRSEPRRVPTGQEAGDIRRIWGLERGARVQDWKPRG